MRARAETRLRNGDHVSGLHAPDVPAIRRGAVEPECRFYLAGRPARVRRTMFSYRTEGYVDRRLVYEGEILGMVV